MLAVRNKITRTHWQRLCVVGVVLLLVAAQKIAGTEASADYEGDEYQLNSGGENVSNNNDEIYEAAVLQQEVEISERKKQANQEMDTNTVAPVKDIRNISSNQISGEYNSMEHENMTEEEEEKTLSSEDYDENMTHSLTTPKASGVATTLIPEYVRKAKAESFPPTMATVANEEEIEANVSLSDYTEDEPDANSRELANGEPIANMQSDELVQDDIVPIAMKYYQNVAPPEEDNKLKEQQPQPLPQQQLLPQPAQPQPFQPRSTADAAAYYEDSRESVDQHQQPPDADGLLQSSPTTSAAALLPISTTTTLPTQPPNNVPIPRAAIPDSVLLYSGSWQSTTTAPHTVAAPATPTPITTASTTTSAATRPPVIVADPAQAAGLPESTTTAAAAAATTTTTTTAPPITTMRPAGKQGKQINITRRKLLPHEQLRNYIEDAYIRMPLAVIVDPSAESLEKTKALWRDALRTNLNIKIVLVSLNASGIPAAYNFNSTRQFLAGLNSIKENDGGNAFIGIVHASELVPYDSAVFISTAAIPRHTDLVQDAAITLLKKRIRLYLIWHGERAISENETQEAVGGILGEVAIRSGGEILHIVGSENSQELEGSTLTLAADAFRGVQELEIPVDTTLSSLHVKIDEPMRSATLETPNGDINLKKLVKFKSHILTLGADDKRLDAYVPLTKLRKASVFKLKMVPVSLDREYSVFVRAERKADQFLDDMIKRFDSYFMEGIGSYPTKFRDSRLQSITAALAAATIPTHDNLRFPDDEQQKAKKMDAVPKDEVEIFSENEIHKDTEEVNNSTALADVRTTALENQRATNVLQRGVTKIEMGIQSQVLVAPGMMAQLYFEVTNTRTDAVFHNIQVVDERRYLLRLGPQSIFLRPGEQATITVTVLIPNGTPQGTLDRITFTCHGGGTSSLSLNLRVITTVDAQDTTWPSISWYFGNRCENIATDATNCAERFWTLDITAQDWETGILRLQSTPTAGLIYRNSYIVGSADPLKATYIASCCKPKVSLIAYDIAGNQRSQNIDVRDIVLTEASIAAIVLGSLLLLLLIVAVIVGIIWCCRRRKVSLDLPTYRSHSTRSME